jgi:D-alanine transaminase
MLVYLDGDYLPHERAKVSVDDRGFLFGDGVYEVIRAFDGRFFTADEHLRRLERGLQGLDIRWTGGTDTILEIGRRLLAENDLAEGDATLYLQITRGAAPRTHAFPATTTPPTLYASTSRFVVPHELRERGVDAITHADLRWSRCDLKTVNLLPNAMAKQRAVEAGAWESIFLRDGVVTEGASTNVFGILDGQLRTYPKCNYILPGITRDVILELAAEREIPVAEEPILAEELPRLEELFLTGTTTDVQPVVRLDGRAVGDGVPGPIARALQTALTERIRGAVAYVAP